MRQKVGVMMDLENRKAETDGEIIAAFCAEVLNSPPDSPLRGIVINLVELLKAARMEGEL